MNHLVTSLLKTRSQTQEAIRRLELIGVTDKQISLVMSDETRAHDWEGVILDDGDNSDEAAASGATAGGLFGAVFGALTTAGAMLVPGLNVVIAGPVLGALAGATLGAGGGGLIGALVGAGLTESETAVYQKEIRNGAVLLVVKAKDETQKEEIMEILDQAKASEAGAFGSRNSTIISPSV